MKIIIFTVLAIVLVAGCTQTTVPTTYTCPDGTVVSSIDQCPGTEDNEIGDETEIIPLVGGFSGIGVLSSWSITAEDGTTTMFVENEESGTVFVTQLTIDVGDGEIECDVDPDIAIGPAGRTDISCTPKIGWVEQKVGDKYGADITISYTYSGQDLSSIGTLSASYV
jgi:hypothetical protein